MSSFAVALGLQSATQPVPVHCCLKRTLELQRADLAAVMAFKSPLIDDPQRFIDQLVTRSRRIAVGVTRGII